MVSSFSEVHIERKLAFKDISLKKTQLINTCKRSLILDNLVKKYDKDKFSSKLRTSKV